MKTRRSFESCSAPATTSSPVCTGRFAGERKLEVGNTIYEYGEGAKVTITSPLDGSKETYTCKEGKWVKTAMLEVSGTVVSPVGALREPVQESAGSTSGTSPTSGAMAPVQTTATLY